MKFSAHISVEKDNRNLKKVLEVKICIVKMNRIE